eukprot:COSAG02_NODE_10603_length_1902_cov_1.330006_1_plen_333_part_00
MHYSNTERIFAKCFRSVPSNFGRIYDQNCGRRTFAATQQLYPTKAAYIDHIESSHITDATFRAAGWGIRTSGNYCRPHLHPEDHEEHRCERCNALYFGRRGGASLKAHRTKKVSKGGCPGAPSLTGSGLKSKAVRQLKRIELADLMPKVKTSPGNWAGVTDKDMLELDEDGCLALQNLYEMKYLGAQIRADADPMHEVERRTAAAMRVHWNLRTVWGESRLTIADKMRLYIAAVVSVATYGCEAWRLNPQVISRLRHMNSRCLARIYSIEVRDCAHRSPWDIVNYVRMRRITWLGGVLRRDGKDVIRKIVLEYAKVLLRHRRQDRVALILGR